MYDEDVPLGSNVIPIIVAIGCAYFGNFCLYVDNNL